MCHQPGAPSVSSCTPQCHLGHNHPFLCLGSVLVRYSGRRCVYFPLLSIADTFISLSSLASDYLPRLVTRWLSVCDPSCFLTITFLEVRHACPTKFVPSIYIQNVCFFKSVLMFRNTYNEDAVPVLTGRRRSFAPPFSVGSVPPFVCYRLCRPYGVAASNTKNASIRTSSRFSRARTNMLIPRFGTHIFSPMELPVCNAKVQSEALRFGT
jgi:hypothetical protein